MFDPNDTAWLSTQLNPAIQYLIFYVCSSNFRATSQKAFQKLENAAEKVKTEASKVQAATQKVFPQSVPRVMERLQIEAPFIQKAPSEDPQIGDKDPEGDHKDESQELSHQSQDKSKELNVATETQCSIQVLKETTTITTVITPPPPPATRREQLAKLDKTSVGMVSQLLDELNNTDSQDPKVVQSAIYIVLHYKKCINEHHDTFFSSKDNAKYDEYSIRGSLLIKAAEIIAICHVPKLTLMTLSVTCKSCLNI